MPLVPQIGTTSTRIAQNTEDWHSHRAFELVFVIEGATAWEFQDDATKEVTGGHFIVVPPGVVHRAVRSIRKPSSICGVFINPECRQCGKNTTFTKQDIYFINSVLSKSASAVAPFGRELMAHLNRMVVAKLGFERDEKNPLAKANLRTLACSVIMEAICCLVATPPGEPTAVITAAKNYLRQHVQNPIQMPDLIKHMGFSRSYLFSIFKMETGMTPNDYYVRIRIERAQELLIESTASVTAIAMDTGFSSSQYFSSVFRKITGQTPLEFRQNSQSFPVGLEKTMRERKRARTTRNAAAISQFYDV